MKSFGSRYNAWGRRNPPSSRSAANAIDALPPRSEPRAWRISGCCTACCSADFLGFTVDQLGTSMDLERSFGPVYARGLLRRGQSAFAVLGVNAQETQGSIDAALTFGILWLDACRIAKAGKFAVEGLKLFLPIGASALTRERMAHLNPEAAKWQLYELEERDDNLKELDISDCGNVATRLVHSTDESAARDRFAAAIAQVRELMSEAEVAILSPAEIAFRCSWPGVRARALGTSARVVSQARPRLSSGWARKNKFSAKRMSRRSPNWCEASAKCAIPRARVTIRYGGCIPNAGWNRWSCATSRQWTNVWIPPVCIPRYRRFLLPIAP